jgi:hypothetical protein
MIEHIGKLVVRTFVFGEEKPAGGLLLPWSKRSAGSWRPFPCAMGMKKGALRFGNIT